MNKEKRECYCCHKVKDCIAIIVNLSTRIEKLTNTEITSSEVRFVCYSCNHLESKNEISNEELAHPEE